jgi:hypothetical protein
VNILQWNDIESCGFALLAACSLVVFVMSCCVGCCTGAKGRRAREEVQARRQAEVEVAKASKAAGGQKLKASKTTGALPARDAAVRMPPIAKQGTKGMAAAGHWDVRQGKGLWILVFYNKWCNKVI